ncbi:beta-1,6-N-acetylglucosaminyltransferase [Vagococcus penaei]|uniref:Peptide O-xylosyltransferase n=1 Tax=Vagococcus penaei TaxID=633807 RepID=A0A1Q2D459_9ENTE|nr:beta-1,6-N-acetylglucosaminyltransferase [Vagococcus penaei]AQP53091.1 hypothetical protein BW732_01845 [Vagococcus penaei]
MNNIIKKHAYLIIADRNQEQLKLLVGLLDSSKNDIFILIDSKSNEIDKNLSIYTKFSKVTFLDRIPIYWGSYSQVQAQLNLIKESIFGEYYYYHYLSGLDLPLCSQEVIHNFFEKNENKIFITFSKDVDKKSLNNRTKKYFGTKYFRSHQTLTSKIKKFFFHKVNKLSVMVTKSRLKDRYLGFGSNWVSLNHSFALKLLKNEEWIYQKFNNGFLVDELFMPSVIIKEKLEDTIYYNVSMINKETEFQGNLRYINWWDGTPYVWKLKDYETLKKARLHGHLFSRKFDNKIDDKIISKVIEELIPLDNNKGEN